MNGALHQYGKQFFSWWGKELFTLLPAVWQRKLQPVSNRLLLQVAPQGVHIIWVNQDRISDLGIFSLDEQGRSACQDKLAADAAISKAEHILVLSPGQFVDRHLLLPEQAASNLHQVMGFEMDRYTPFPVEQAFFDVLPTDAEAQNNKIRVHLAATSREELESLLGELAFFNLAPTTVSFSEKLELPLDGEGFNLLPTAMRPAVGKTGPLLMAGLVLLLLVELMAAVIYPSWHAEQEAANLQGQIDAIQDEVRAISDMRSGTEQMRSQVDSLLEKTASKPYVIDIMKELTNRLPADTWLIQLRLTGNSLQLQGYSEKATRLIQILDDSPLFENSRFTSPLASSKAGQQAFKIGLVVKGR